MATVDLEVMMAMQKLEKKTLDAIF